MNQGTYPLAAAMINQFNRIDTISNSLANANTNGFKEEGLVEGSFNNYLDKAKNKSEYISTLNTLTNTIPKIDGKYISSAQGSIVATGNELDFALTSKDTFFMVEGTNGEVLYTRDGSFKNLDGSLVTNTGAAVLSIDGAPIEVEEGFASNLGVSKTDFKNLEKIGDNNYRVRELNEVEVVDELDTEIMQGALEKSNVNSVSAMVGLIDANRRFEQAQKAIKGIDELNKDLIQKLGRRN